MCLTGVDYFSTLAYQPGIAFLAAGTLAPIATLILVLVIVLAALPMHDRLAEMGLSGQGSILMLESLIASPLDGRVRPLLGVRPGDASQFADVLKVESAQGRPLSRAALPEPRHPQRHRRAAPAHPRPNGAHEVLRKSVPDPLQRPRVHVG
jgi:hypothetical protein